jgi:hypothetical protein
VGVGQSKYVFEGSVYLEMLACRRERSSVFDPKGGIEGRIIGGKVADFGSRHLDFFCALARGDDAAGTKNIMDKYALPKRETTGIERW